MNKLFTAHLPLPLVAKEHWEIVLNKECGNNSLLYSKKQPTREHRSCIRYINSSYTIAFLHLNYLLQDKI